MRTNFRRREHTVPLKSASVCRLTSVDSNGEHFITHDSGAADPHDGCTCFSVSVILGKAVEESRSVVFETKEKMEVLESKRVRSLGT